MNELAYSQALVEEYSGDTCSDGEPSVQSNGSPTQLAYLPPDRMTAFSRLSRFGMTYKPLTEDRGETLLTSYLAAFRAKTSAPQEREPELTAQDRGCGVIWRESLAKYDPDTSTWRTPHSLLNEESIEFSGTWPRWGLMRDGVSYQQPSLAHHTKETGSGSWPTPLTQDSYERSAWKIIAQANEGGKARMTLTRKVKYLEKMWSTPTARDWKDSGPSQGKRKSPSLGTQVHWPTPRTKGMCGGSGAWNQLNKITTPEEVRQMGAGNGGQLNPTWVEWLMGWPLGWTDLKPLEMDKYRLWQQQHGVCSPDLDG